MLTPFVRGYDACHVNRRINIFGETECQRPHCGAKSARRAEPPGYLHAAPASGAILQVEHGDRAIEARNPAAGCKRYGGREKGRRTPQAWISPERIEPAIVRFRGR